MQGKFTDLFVTTHKAFAADAKSRAEKQLSASMNKELLENNMPMKYSQIIINFTYIC